MYVAMSARMGYERVTERSARVSYTRGCETNLIATNEGAKEASGRQRVPPVRVGRLSDVQQLGQESIVGVVLLLDAILGLGFDASDEIRVLGKGDESLELGSGKLESFRLDGGLESCRRVAESARVATCERRLVDSLDGSARRMTKS
jgi:hypothetical protein